MNPRGRACSELRSRHCTPAWATERDSVSKNKPTKKQTNKWTAGTQDIPDSAVGRPDPSLAEPGATEGRRWKELMLGEEDLKTWTVPGR